MTQLRFRHEIVDSIPETLQSNTLYVTADRDVAGHLCACGCGREVITPLSPTDWSVSFGRQGASLSPSIGNWAFPCRSHYFIWGGAVVWARDMSDKAIAQGRHLDKARKQNYYDKLGGVPQTPSELTPPVADQTLLDRLLGLCKRLLTW